jgi:DNA-binding GntR family transcriptional regulator
MQYASITYNRNTILLAISHQQHRPPIRACKKNDLVEKALRKHCKNTRDAPATALCSQPPFLHRMCG